MSGLFRPRREPADGPDPWLPLKLALFGVAAATAIAGMALDRAWLINAAIGLLAIGLVIRFFGPR